MAHKTIAQIAHKHLTDHGFDRVMYGDAHLLHEIAEAAGMKHDGWKTERNVLNALEESPLFDKQYFRAMHGLARVFICQITPPSDN